MSKTFIFSTFNKSHIKGILALVFMCQVAFAQKSELNLVVIEPTWNKTVVCDDGRGVKLGSINSPFISYVGKVEKDPLYEFVWEQRIDNGSWKIVSKGKSNSFIPAFELETIQTEKELNQVRKLEWRLLVTDIANGNLSKQSDIFSIQIAPNVTIKAKIVKNELNSKKVDILLESNGGFAEKKFNWSKAGDELNLDEATQTNSNLIGVKPGIYQIKIADGCGLSDFTINTETSEVINKQKFK